MKYRNATWKKGGAGKFLAGLLLACCLLVISACGGSNAVHVYDNARVLDAARVQNAASDLSYPLDVYTTSTFTGDKADFQRTTAGHLNGHSDHIVLAIDTTHHYVYLARGTRVPLSQDGISSTISAFSGHFGNGDYTGATLASIDSMHQSLGSGGGNSFSGAPTTLLCVGLVLLAIILFAFGAMRRRRFGWGRPAAPYQQPMDSYNQGIPYNQGNYYGPPNQGGMNPWAAGGLGAAAGGLIGYELGKEAGERDYGSGGDFGGGGGGDFGGGGGGDFGNGGGSDFGGGGGGDFGSGGGGDFGGGGGNF